MLCFMKQCVPKVGKGKYRNRFPTYIVLDGFRVFMKERDSECTNKVCHKLVHDK